MNAAEHENNGQNEPREEDFSFNAPTSSTNTAEASFTRLLQQLEAERGQEPTGAGVSQIFSTVQTPAAAPETTRQPRAAGIDAQAFAPRGAASSAFGGSAFDPKPPVANVAVTSETPAPVQPSPLTFDEQATAPHAPSAPPPLAASAVPSAPPEQPGEFTRIFTQLPTPRSAPPAILAEVAASAPQPAPEPSKPGPSQPGEFTQLFQAIDPSRGGTLPSPAAPLSQSANIASQSAAAVPRPVQPAQPAFQTAAPLAEQASPDRPATTQAFAADNFNPSAAASPKEAQRQPEPAQPGSFTAFFETPPAPGSAAPASFVAKAASDDATPAYPAAFAQPPRSQPPGSGGFTELLHSLSSDSAAPAPGVTPSAAFGNTQGHGSVPDFASNLAPEAPRPAPAAARSYSDTFSPVAAPAPQPPRAPLPANAFAPQGSNPQSPQQAPAGQARPGEFTELMQSLQQPAAKLSTPPESQASFFAGTPISSAGPSEFTRILQGSAARSAEVPVPTFAPARQPSGAAVGLPIAAPHMPKPAVPALPTAEAKTALQKMMPWLLAANGALLLLLIALAVMFLRHRH